MLNINKMSTQNLFIAQDKHAFYFYNRCYICVILLYKRMLAIGVYNFINYFLLTIMYYK